jgi:hypothetical protein
VIPRPFQRLIRALAGPPTPEQAGHVLGRRAAQLKAQARRKAIAAHIATFGDCARGLDHLNEGKPNV